MIEYSYVYQTFSPINSHYVIVFLCSHSGNSTRLIIWTAPVPVYLRLHHCTNFLHFIWICSRKQCPGTWSPTGIFVGGGASPKKPPPPPKKIEKLCYHVLRGLRGMFPEKILTMVLPTTF